MNDFLHPRRFPKNAAGPFYTTGSESKEGWGDDCLECQAPEVEAPDLLAPHSEDNFDTYFVRQPQTKEEIKRACNAIGVCCVAALRYGGRDPEIIRALGNNPEHCDYILDAEGNLMLAPMKKLPVNSRWWQSCRDFLHHFIRGLFSAPYLPSR